jgi:hypothetical protein
MVVGSLITVFSGILVVGAINRTIAKNEHTTQEATNQISRRSREQVEADNVERDFSGNRSSSESSEQNRHGQNRQSNVGQAGDFEPETMAQVSEWTSIQGKIVAVTDDAIEVILQDGDQYVIEGRALRFAQELGFMPVIDDELKLVGFYEGSEFELSQIVDLATKDIFTLREDSGRPLWAGRRGQQGI